MRKRVVYSALGFLLGLIILIGLIYNIGLKNILETIKGTNIAYVIIAFLILILSHILASINIKIFSNSLNYSIKYFTIFKYFMINILINQVIPIRISSITSVILLKRANIKTKDGIAIIFVDKIITLSLLSLLTILGLVYFFTREGGLLYLKYVLAFIIITLIIIIFTFSRKLESKIISIFAKFKAYKITGFSDAAKKIMRDKKRVGKNTAITLIKLISEALLVYSLFLSFSIKGNILEFILISFLVTTISAIPISANGLGIREVSAVGLYSSLMGINSVTIASAFLILLFLKYFLSLLFLTFILVYKT